MSHLVTKITEDLVPDRGLGDIVKLVIVDRVKDLEIIARQAEKELRSIVARAKRGDALSVGDAEFIEHTTLHTLDALRQRSNLEK